MSILALKMYREDSPHAGGSNLNGQGLSSLEERKHVIFRLAFRMRFCSYKRSLELSYVQQLQGAAGPAS